MSRWFQNEISCNESDLALTTVHRNPENWETYTLGTPKLSPGVPLRRRIGIEWESQFRSASLFRGRLYRRTSLREPVVGDFGTGPAFVSNPAKTKDARRRGEAPIALRAEFVIKPGNEETVRETIDLILANSFCRDRQFLQGLVLVSELEARLMTVITFWKSDGIAEVRERRVAQLRRKLQPYLDQSPRVQSFSAHVMDGKTDSNAEAMGLGEDSFSHSEESFSASIV